MRVESQKTRQMLLVTGDPLNPDELPEKVQLFNEQGDPLMIGMQGVRATIVHTTAPLAAGATEQSPILAFPGWRVIMLETNRPARVRLYPTAAKRLADLNRSVGVKPPLNSGRLLELVSAPTMLSFYMNPTVDLAAADPLDSTFYVSVTNLDTVTGPVVTTYTYVRTE